jgi:hypothetical protein
MPHEIFYHVWTAPADQGLAKKNRPDAEGAV